MIDQIAPYIIVAGIIAALAAAVSERSERREFLTDCAKAKPRYECIALWRSGDRDGLRLELRTETKP